VRLGVICMLRTLACKHLQEADYRGDRYPDHPYELMGNDDVLVVTFPDVVEVSHNQATMIPNWLTRVLKWLNTCACIRESLRCG